MMQQSHLPITTDLSGKKILYILSRLPHFFYHDSIITALCESGARVDLMFVKRAQIGKNEQQEELKQGVLERLDTLQSFQKRYPNLTIQELKGYQRHIGIICTYLRFIRSYASYIQRATPSNYYLKRWFHWMPANAQRLCSNTWVMRFLRKPYSIEWLEKIDLWLPSNRYILRILRQIKPDWIVVSPADTRTISDAEWIKAGKKLGVRTAVVVLSWDNLTTKGLIHIRPDAVFAWNQIQADDAAQIHHIVKEKLHIVGAPFFDKWREAAALTQPRDSFMRSQRLNPDLPYIVYLGSSGNIAQDETWLIRELATALKTSDDPLLQQVQLLVRPHSSSQEHLKKLADLPIILTDSAYIGVPFSKERQSNMFNTFMHCAVTVSINTSAIIDALLVGKSCISIETEQYHDTHIGSAHFKNLLDYQAVILVNTMEECLYNIRRHLLGEDPLMQQRERFYKEFIASPEKGKTAGESIADFLMA